MSNNLYNKNFCETANDKKKSVNKKLKIVTMLQLNIYILLNLNGKSKKGYTIEKKKTTKF